MNSCFAETDYHFAHRPTFLSLESITRRSAPQFKFLDTGKKLKIAQHTYILQKSRTRQVSFVIFICLSLFSAFHDICFRARIVRRTRIASRDDPLRLTGRSCSRCSAIQGFIAAGR